MPKDYITANGFIVLEERGDKRWPGSHRAVAVKTSQRKPKLGANQIAFKLKIKLACSVFDEYCPVVEIDAIGSSAVIAPEVTIETDDAE